MSRVMVRDRRWLAVAVGCGFVTSTAGLLTSMRTDLSWAVGVLGGAAVGVLAVLALPSLPTRIPTIVVIGLAGVLVAHNAGLATDDSWLLVLWGGALVFTLVATERLSNEAIRPIGAQRPRWVLARDVVRDAAVISVAVGVLALLLAPLALDRLSPASTTGSPPTAEGLEDAPSSLRANQSLDMTRRPRLGDAVVLRVRANRPDFWRGETFDVWDGRTWTRSDDRVLATLRDGEQAAVVPQRLALPAGGEPWTQQFRVEAEYAEVVFGAPVIVGVEADRRMVQRDDGTVIATFPYGSGALYTVSSVRVPATRASLSSSDPRRAPAEILQRYAAPPVISARVARAAEAAVDGAPTTYDAIRALEAWLGSTTEYSIDAPLAPEGVDVVDHFVFESRQGWCQQISSTLAVMLRHLGVPARVATGFVPGEYDGLAGEYVVRERDAHQWVEVYFPGVGWQGFDPTASVPLSGESERSTTPTSWLADNWPQVLGVVVITSLALGALWWVGRVRRRRARLRDRTWAGHRLEDLETLGARSSRPRRPHETPLEYGSTLAELLGDEGMLDVGEAISCDAWSLDGLDADSRHRAEEILEARRS